MRRTGRRTCLAWVFLVWVQVVLGWGAAPLPPAAAQVGSERITAYDVDIRVEPSGSMVVTETIDYDFGSARRHGILRDVPVRLDHDSRQERIYPLRVLSVEGSPGTPDRYETEGAGRYKRIRIGDPDER